MLQHLASPQLARLDSLGARGHTDTSGLHRYKGYTGSARVVSRTQWPRVVCDCRMRPRASR
jgi:hypothetical protein